MNNKLPDFYTLKPGWVSNPLRKFRNIKCPCDSGKKAKHCCGNQLAVPSETAKHLKAYLSRRSLKP